MDTTGDSHSVNPKPSRRDSLLVFRAMGPDFKRSPTRTMMALTALSLCLMASAPVPELLHVLGIVTSIDEKHIDVKTTKGPLVSVLLTKQVKYKNKNNPKSLAPPAVGDRVIIEASKDDKQKKITATVVHYSPGSPPPSPR